MDIKDMSAQKLKLTNSRKRFKELQELRKHKNTTKSKLPVESDNNSKNVITRIDSKTNASHSSTNEQIQENTSDIFMQLPNYFNDNNMQYQSQTPAVFFDSFSQDLGCSTKKHINNTDNSNTVNVNTLPIHITKNIMSDTADSLNRKGSEIRLETDLVVDHGLVEDTHVKETQQLMHQSELIITNQPEIMHKEIYDMRNLNMNLKGGISNDANLAISEDITNYTANKPNVGVENSSVESLLQLSDQIAHLVEPDDCISSSITDLEKRNLELATLLEQEKITSERQHSLINGLESKISQLDLSRDKDEIGNIHLIRERSRLNDELQYYIQTVGMLVAEKAELAANVSKFELTSTQKSAECEELQTLLKASRSHMVDLEKEINILKCEKTQNEKTVKEQTEVINKLQQDCNIIKKQNEEVIQDILEMTEKLNNKTEETVMLKKQNLDLSSKLSLASIKVQQLTTGEQMEITSQLEKISEDKIELECRLSNINQLLQSITKERDESNLQYQQYAQQQSAQLATLSNKIEQLQIENENLSRQEQNRIQHITELERQLQHLQSEEVIFNTNKSSDSILKTDLDNTRELCVQLQIEKTNHEENYMKVTNEKKMLLKELEAKNESLRQLEDMVDRLRGNQPDSVKLLAAIESDKVAAARAVQQNRDIKQQLESMEEVLLKLNNDKVELTERLDVEVKSNKELLEKLQRTELHLQRLTDAIEIKDRELSHLKDIYANLNIDSPQREELTNNRQYEALDNTHILQNQLQEAKQTIVNLTNEIHFLKHGINGKDRCEVIDHANINSVSAELTCQNEYSRAHLENENTNISNYFQNHNNILDKEVAMKHLEEKFTRTMQDIANLTEERQQLDHLVLQLQGETETIGEYVALYQHQRMILKQKTLEKDQQLKQLAIDRNQMKLKLEKLSKLIRKLVKCNIAAPVQLLQEVPNESTQNIECYKDPHSAHELCNINDDTFTEQDLNLSEMANEILMLLSDIKSSNLMQTTDIHNCPWCSGQLMTV